MHFDVLSKMDIEASAPGPGRIHAVLELYEDATEVYLSLVGDGLVDGNGAQWCALSGASLQIPDTDMAERLGHALIAAAYKARVSGMRAQLLANRDRKGGLADETP